MTSQVVGSDFTAGAQLPNYVNGRLLTAEDLATSQATLRAWDRKLGQAAGHGVVNGLWVTFSATTITVAPGLGVAPSGDAISVTASVALPLTLASPAAATSANGSFSCCASTADGTGTAIGAGCYLLTALPACQLSGQAPLAAAATGAAAPSAGCAAQWKVEGVQFKAITLPLGDTLMGITVTDDNRRNLLAHWCLGSAQLANLGADPFSFAPAYGGFDTLDPADLTPADLPLAVFYFNGQTVSFVDNGSARRRITAPDPVTASWSALTTDRRESDGSARLLQFQDQAADLVASGAAGQTAAETTFPLLPPVGFLQIGAQHVSNVFDRIKVAAGQALQTASSARLADFQVASRVAEEAAVPGQGAPAVVTPVAAANLPLFATDHEAVLLGVTTVAASQLDEISATLAARPAQPGFDLTTFFGTAVTCGGILDWEIADFALRQTWRCGPGQPVAPTDQSAPEPYTYFLVSQNLAAGSLGADGPPLYVVFVKTLSWLTNTRLPFGTSSPTSVLNSPA
jgi:hypothetical protein